MEQIKQKQADRGIGIAAAPSIGHTQAGPGAGVARPTQSFVGVLSSVWKRPSVTALEIVWRWAYGIPALWLLVWQGRKVLAEATDGTMDWDRLGLDRAFLNDPVGALSADQVGIAAKIARAAGLLLPGAEHVAIWLLPVLVVAWIVASSVGRTLVLRRIDQSLKVRTGTLMGLQAVRVCVLAALFGSWVWALGAIGRGQVSGPIAAGQEPDLIVYCALVIVLSLGLFTGWGFVSWRLSVAPLLAMAEGTGVIGSLRAAGGLGSVKGRLVEINLVLSVVKIALIVLAMVFSATPLPFESVTTQGFLQTWWAGVAVVYLVWSDFFHVARLVGYLELWRAGRVVE